MAKCRCCIVIFVDGTRESTTMTNLSRGVNGARGDRDSGVRIPGRAGFHRPQDGALLPGEQARGSSDGSPGPARRAAALRRPGRVPRLSRARGGRRPRAARPGQPAHGRGNLLLPQPRAVQRAARPDPARDHQAPPRQESVPAHLERRLLDGRGALLPGDPAARAARRTSTTGTSTSWRPTSTRTRSPPPGRGSTATGRSARSRSTTASSISPPRGRVRASGPRCSRW